MLPHSVSKYSIYRTTNRTKIALNIFTRIWTQYINLSSNAVFNQNLIFDAAVILLCNCIQNSRTLEAWSFSVKREEDSVFRELSLLFWHFINATAYTTWANTSAHLLLLKNIIHLKMGHPRPLFHLFLSFQTHITNFSTISYVKNMSIQYTVPGFELTTFGTRVFSHNH